MILTKGVYGTEFSPKLGPFQLKSGQMRVGELVHNGGWYNGLGEKLGWGDLDHADLLRIRQDIPEDESFLILSEGDSFWNFVENVGTIGSLSTMKPEADAPGIDYVVDFAFYMVTKGHLYAIGSQKYESVYKGLKLEPMTSTELKARLAK